MLGARPGRDDARGPATLVGRCCCAAALACLALVCGRTLGTGAVERSLRFLGERRAADRGRRAAKIPEHTETDRFGSTSGRSPSAEDVGPEHRRLSQGTGRRNGIGFVLSGYNVFKGNPSSTRGSVDPGFQHAIFEALYTGGKTPNGRYQIPEGLTLLPCDGSCSEKSTVQIIKNVHDYVTSLSSKVEFDVQGYGMRFGASFDYQRLEQGATAEDEVYSFVEAACCSYKVELDSFSSPQLTANFIAAVESMPTEYDQASYFELINEFGTHYISSAAMGGVYGQETTFKRSRWQKMVSDTFDWRAYAQASFFLSISAGAGSNTTNNDSKFFQSYSHTQSIYSLGQRPPASGKWIDWMKNDSTAPAPIKSQLLPISMLFEPRFFKGNSASLEGLAAKEKNVVRALTEYCVDLLLKQGLVTSCSTPVPDAAAAAPDVVCLGRVWGGGGDTGKPFDDGTTLITENGLFSHLQVAQIAYQIGPTVVQQFVQGIQLVLQMGDTHWPLPGHGHINHPWKTTFEPGSKITSVLVEFCHYVNGLTFYTEDGDEQRIGGAGGCNTSLVDFKDVVRKELGTVTRLAWLVGLMGRSDKWLDKIGFYFAYTVPAGDSCPGVGGVVARHPRNSST